MKFKDFWKNGEFKKSIPPRVFSMIRRNDESGTSGTGHVLDGVIFPCGKTVVCWDPDEMREDAKIDGGNVNSVAVFDSFEAFEKIHIGQHPTNLTQIKFLN